MKQNQVQEYRSTIKSNLAFGGIKIFKSLISLLRIKITALFLGPSGMGILTLISSSIDTIHQFTTCGIFTSGVRYIVLKKEEQERYKVIKVLQILSAVLGIVGAVFCIIFSKAISNVVFGIADYSLWFIIISTSLFFESITNCQIAIFQGLRQINKLARSSVIGAFLSLLVTLPFYYLLKVDAIPFVLLVSYFIISAVYFLYRKKVINLRNVKVDINVVKKESKPIVKFGIVLAFSSLIMTFLVFVQNTFIRHFGTTEDVGFFQASQTCTYYVLSIIIAIISTDFYPKITSHIEDVNYVKLLLNQQSEILMFVTAFIVVIIINFPELVINVLFSKKFLAVKLPIQIMSLSLLFRVIWHIMSYIILAKGDKHSYLLYDVIIGNGTFFALNLIGYYFKGIPGVAFSYLVGSIFVAIFLSCIVKSKYSVSLSIRNIKVLVVVILHLVILFLNSFLEYHYRVYISIVVSLSLFTYSFYIINKSMGIISYLKKIVHNDTKGNK